MSSPTKTIPCDIDDCNLPVGEITNSTLIIVSRHHGKKHPKTITLNDLLRLLSEESDTKLLTAVDKPCFTAAER